MKQYIPYVALLAFCAFTSTSNAASDSDSDDDSCGSPVCTVSAAKPAAKGQAVKKAAVVLVIDDEAEATEPGASAVLKKEKGLALPAPFTTEDPVDEPEYEYFVDLEASIERLHNVSFFSVTGGLPPIYKRVRRKKP